MYGAGPRGSVAPSADACDIGTPCSDNTTTEAFHDFLALLSDAPETVTYLEFRADYQVELRFADGSERLVPFLQLPISQLPPDFFPLTCRTCVDYTNVLADITVGYMGGQGAQWLLVRNARGDRAVAARQRGESSRCREGFRCKYRAGGWWVAAQAYA